MIRAAAQKTGKEIEKEKFRLATAANAKRCITFNEANFQFGANAFGAKKKKRERARDKFTKCNNLHFWLEAAVCAYCLAVIVILIIC